MKWWSFSCKWSKTSSQDFPEGLGKLYLKHTNPDWYSASEAGTWSCPDWFGKSFIPQAYHSHDTLQRAWRCSMPTFLFWFVLPLLRYLVKERYPRFLEKNNESQIKVSQKLNADSLLRWEKAFVVNLLFTGNIYNYIYYVLINLVCNSLIHFLECLISTFLNREKKF